VLHTSLLNTTVVAFKVPPLGSYAQMPAPSPRFKTILEMVLWNGLQSCCCIISDVVKLIAVEVLHTSLLNTTVVAFKVLSLGSYAPMPAPSPPFKTI